MPIKNIYCATLVCQMHIKSLLHTQWKSMKCAMTGWPIVHWIVLLGSIRCIFLEWLHWVIVIVHHVMPVFNKLISSLFQVTALSPSEPSSSRSWWTTSKKMAKAKWEPVTWKFKTATIWNIMKLILITVLTPSWKRLFSWKSLTSFLEFWSLNPGPLFETICASYGIPSWHALRG